MSEQQKDRDLGMHRQITRRDFLNGAAFTMGSILTVPHWLSAMDIRGKLGPTAQYYPPALMGMRGDHDGSYGVAHDLRDAGRWKSTTRAQNTGERYELAVVGGGISGLAAAYFYQQMAGGRARILVLDNHDDFGGHAKRNEFRVGGRVLLAYGGSQSIESPSRYSKVAKKLITDLGIDTGRFYKAYDQGLYSSMKLGTGCFFDRETFGADLFIAGMGTAPWPEFLAKAPLSESARRDIARVYGEKVDYLPGLSRDQKRARLAKISYADFLTQIVRLHKDVLPFFQTRTHDLWGVGIDAVSTLAIYEAGDDYGIGYPGLDGMGLGQAGERGEEKTDPYIFHFPDGNASIARLLVRSLVPGAIPGKTMDDVVTAKANYGLLDRDGSPVRLRLNSTVVHVRHLGKPEVAKEVEIEYVSDGKLKSVRAKSCVLACFNGMVPYLCPELPATQREALSYGVKTPLVYTHVALRNWTAFRKLGVHQVVAPGSYHVYVALDFPVSLGQYHFPSRPEEPMVLFMLRTPCQPGLSERDQHRAGRMELLNTPFSTFERNIRDQLGRMLTPAAFDPARDIDGITVNRWAHGYAYGYNSLFDPDWPEDQRPHVVGRKPFGRITIANSDAAATAYADAAIDEAHRAVQELPA